MEHLKPLARLLRAAIPSKKIFVFGLVLMLIEAGASLVIPLLTRDFVDGMQTAALPKFTLALLLGFMIVDAVIGGLAYYYLGSTGHGIVASLRHKLLGKLIRLPVRFYDNNQSGELASRVVSDTQTLHEVCTYHLTSMVVGLFTVIGSVAILWVLDWRMTLVLFSGVILSTLVIVPIAAKMQAIAEEVQSETAQFSSQLTGVFSEIRLVKSYTAESRELEVGRNSIDRLRQLGNRENAIQAILSPLVSLAMMGAMVAILGYGGARVSAGTLEVGTLVAFILYLFHITIPVAQFSMFFTEIQRAIGSGKHLLRLMKQNEEVVDGADAVSVTDRSIDVEDLGFAYAEEDEDPVLKDVSFSIRPNRVTALVGPSGSGKSTLLALLSRFYEPSSGEIRLGDVSIDTLSLPAWRSKLGYVAQDAPMIAGTIRENLCYGLDREADDVEMRRALEAAHAHDFVDNLPNGLETEIGERGVKLSGGQRQRLAIARALLKNPPILILDEATSHLDSRTEHQVQEAMHRLMQDRTTVVVAHRLATVLDADQIVVLEGGRTTGIGTHDKLMDTNALYRGLVEHQFKPLTRNGQAA
ncbi:ABC transporter ATP-binding protein [Sulfidibacter corallicola]|uniref:ABC transporter ATP-binding protein n=1 Tax=Sulfidibacter corallicola TaxID=2818388 RepID=A0A8A4TYE6_SULCO|nr:ABC transporter ATP-binding protein [Sulfidibacter corallicola]QTD51555.1 ABC transporter ATP-binding protein [Sulfidibacter corallicola]